MLDTLVSGRYHELTDRQRAWVQSVCEELEPTYLNLVSSGKANLSDYGRTPTPEVLKVLPKKPPGRG